MRGVTPAHARSAQAAVRQRSDAAANRERLLKAANALFAEHGVEVPFEDIAVAAGVGRTTLYRNFPSRQHLHGAIQEQFVEQLEAAADRLAASPDAFMALFRAAVRIQRAQPPGVAQLPPQEELRDHVRALRTRVRTCFREPLILAQEAGLARAGLTPEDVRIQLVMLSAVNRRDVPKSTRDRAWQLACAALTGE
jgi:AcrR family transcriptional regulator